MIDTSYKFRFAHSNTATIDLIKDKRKFNTNNYEYSYGAYLTDVAEARRNCEEVIRNSTAGGMTLNFNVLYPNDFGLGGFGTQYSEKSYVWGSNDLEDD